TYGPVTQGELLIALGIRERAERLRAAAGTAQSADIDAALARLTAADGMGGRFKALAVVAPDAGPPPGFG
ncbi:MAG: class I SAM-dependent methyltransferase, partial [Rhodospirillaceae bacterium]